MYNTIAFHRQAHASEQMKPVALPCSGRWTMMCRLSGGAPAGKTAEITAPTSRLGVVSMTFCRRVTSFLASTRGMSNFQSESACASTSLRALGLCSQISRLNLEIVAVDSISTSNGFEVVVLPLRMQNSLSVAIVEVQSFCHEID